MVSGSAYLVVASLLFGLGLFGVLVRRNALFVFMSIELMLNAANLTFLTFARYPLRGPPASGGSAIAFLVIAVAAAEAAVGLALVISLYRHQKNLRLQEATRLQG